MPLTLSPTIRQQESILINSAQLVHKYFKYLGFCDSKMAPDKTRQESCRFMQPQESMIAIDASNSKQGVACKERAESMLPPQKSRELARRLVASETGASTTSLQTEPATVRVYERLRRQFRAPVGADGFQALASRALALAKSESPQLSAVQIAANGGLRGLGEVESQMDLDENGEPGVILIAQLLGLFLTFLGEATTLRLIEDLRLQAEVKTEPVAAQADATASEVDEAAMAVAFEDLLLEIDRLRWVGERIESLADNHPGMEQGLVSVAGNIRSIATVLDVFTLIRSKTGGSQEDPPNPQTYRYMN